MKDLKISNKKIKDLVRGEMVIVIYNGIATTTFYDSDVADYVDDEPPFTEHLFNERSERSCWEDEDDYGIEYETGKMVTTVDYDAVVGMSDGNIALYDLLGVNYLLLDYEDVSNDKHYWNNLPKTTWFAKYDI